MKVGFKSIGQIVSEFNEPKDAVGACEDGLRAGNLSRIVIDRELEGGLRGLEDFSHLFIVYCLDKADRLELVTHPGPPSVRDLPKVGVFASRSQYRPNPIAVRLVELIKDEGNEVVVRGLDGIHGSPVLDIKPYIPGFDRPEKFQVASWYEWLK